jgi:hypothetical protein
MLENEEDDRKVTVEYLFNFLRSHVMSEEATEKSITKSKMFPNKFQRGQLRKDGPQRNWEREEENSQQPYSATALNSNSKDDNSSKFSGELQCAKCGKRHHISSCYLFTRKSVDERLEIVKDKGLCFNCLSPTTSYHYGINCKCPRCSVEGCKRKHHGLLHRNSPSKVKDPQAGNHDAKKHITSDKITSHTGIANGYLSTSIDNQVMLLPTAMVKLVSCDVTLPVCVLVDSGSDQSYIQKEIVDALCLCTNDPAKTMTILMHGGQSRTTRVKRANFQLSTRNQRTNVTLNAWSVPTVCSPPEPAVVNLKQYPHLKGLALADTDPRSGATIDILIGADQWSQIMKSGIKRGSPASPMAMNSVFGWLLSRPTGIERPESHSAFTHHATTRILEDDHNLSLKRFWQLESLGIMDDPQEMSQDEKYVVQQLQESVNFDGERYEVELLWTKNCPKLADNRKIAMKRLVNVEARLKKNPEQLVMYKQLINQYIKDGHARETTIDDDQSEIIQYLPHPVFRKDKSTTKCRAVFDASAKNHEETSLNDCLLPGPVLQPDLVSVLLRFRLHRVAMMADVRKMFLQVKVALKDQNVHRFLWRNMDPTKVVKNYCMTRLPFGDKCSPYLAIATMHHHAEANGEKFPEAAKIIKEDTYVDDFLTGTSNKESAFTLYQDLVNLMKIGGFDLVKWSTNSSQLRSRIPSDQRVPECIVCLDSDSEPLKALGLSWDTEEDVFLFHQGNKLLELSDPKTKRSLVSISSKLFDPLGFIGPFTIRAKILYQEVWLHGLTWDAPLTQEIKEQWRRWKLELKELENGCVCRSLLNTAILNMVDVQLHGFSDASPKAYGAVSYLRLQDCMGNVVVHILIAKSRGHPTK